MRLTSWVSLAAGLLGLAGGAASLPSLPATALAAASVATAPSYVATWDDDLPPRVVLPGPTLERRQPWVLPVRDYRLTGRFGMTDSLWAHQHTGLDFAAPTGTAIHAVAAGRVTSVGYDGAYGLRTVVTLGDGTEIWYCHQSSQLVAAGERVAEDEEVGTVGSTGNVTGPHLHLEVRPGGGEPVDPEVALPAHGVRP